MCLYFNNVLPSRKVWWDLPIMSNKAMIPLGSSIHLYADDVHAISLPVIGSTICKRVECTPLFFYHLEGKCVRKPVNDSYSIYPYVCVCILNIFVCAVSCQAPWRDRVVKEKRHLISWRHKETKSQILIWKWRISLMLFLLSAHSSDIERALHISEVRWGRVYPSVSWRLPCFTSGFILVWLIHHHKNPLLRIGFFKYDLLIYQGWFKIVDC